LESSALLILSISQLASGIGCVRRSLIAPSHRYYIAALRYGAATLP
jgi:hypothetical protein